MSRVTVIVIAHDRRQFLPDALRSIVTQTRRPYDVIVVKNFKDDQIDEYIERSGFTSILLSDERGGAKYERGLREADTDLVAFLDDDDYYLNRKLEVALEAFEKTANLGFYHHNVVIVDAKGIELPCTTDIAYYCEKKLNKKIFLNNNDKYLKIDCISHHGDPLFWLGFNSSSIVMKRDAILPFLDVLKKLYYAQDGLFLISALVSPYALLHDPIELTAYRVHGSQTTRSYNDLDSLISISKRTINDYEVLSDLISELGLHNLINLSKTEFKRSYDWSRLYYGVSLGDSDLVREAIKELLNDKENRRNFAKSTKLKFKIFYMSLSVPIISKVLINYAATRILRVSIKDLQSLRRKIKGDVINNV